MSNKRVYLFSRVLHKASRILSGYFPFVRDYAMNRSSLFLERALAREKADLYIGHNLGSLPAVVKAARKWNSPCGFDAEDYHRGQMEQQSGSEYRLTAYLEEKFMPACDYLTAASPLIARAYEKLLPGKKITVVNNVFSRSFLQHPRVTTGRPLRLFWFSQTLGTTRGLEVVVQALNLLSGYDITFDLIGNCSSAYREQLTGMSNRPGILHFLPPVAPNELFEIAASYDIGMASEVPVKENNDYLLSNKLFTYLTAGNCVLASNTKAQERFLEENPGVGRLYKYDDPKDLADRLIGLYNNPDLLQSCKRESGAIAKSRYNWEYEQMIFLKEVEAGLKR